MEETQEKILNSDNIVPDTIENKNKGALINNNLEVYQETKENIEENKDDIDKSKENQKKRN